ncbi:hypothetical protein ACFO0M_18390 [Micromonospora mangrovi]|uniref:Uncharacterized protein n=2 Tax=Micromonospora TaxID=1873 RepID=A0AAU8HA91_9ACTN
MNPTPTAGHCYLIQLPVVVDDLATAVRVARVIARSLSFHSLVECGEAAVTSVDDLEVRHPAFCERHLPNGRRCLLHPDHDGQCARQLPSVNQRLRR